MNRIPSQRSRERLGHARELICSAALLCGALSSSSSIASPLISTSPTQVLRGDQTGSNFGDAAQTAGDVNGDGYSDLIVGARIYNNGQAAEGRAYVYTGGPSGLSSNPAAVVESNIAGGELGVDVACLGDVDGEAFGDLAVGVPGAGAGGQVWVFDGGSPLDLQSHAVLSGPTAGSDFGRDIAGVGDVNGDGFRDLVVGAPTYTNGQSQEGKIYLFLGSAAGISSSAVWSFESNVGGAQLGTNLSPAGDVNGDGFADLIAGTPRYASGQSREGRAWLFLGGPSGFGGTPSWTFESNQADAQLGVSVANAGDVNGDGYADVIIGADNFDTSLTDAGEALLFLGAPSGLNAAPIMTYTGTQAVGLLGHSVGTAGDVNGDSYADFVIGAPGENGVQSGAGRVHLFLGGPSAPSASAFVFQGTEVSGGLGRLVGTAGDVQNDGFSEIIAGSSLIDLGASNAGAVFVYRGAAAGVRANATWIKPGTSGQGFASSIAVIGDTNGDGYDDFMIPATTVLHGPVQGELQIYRGSGIGPSTTAAQVLTPPSSDVPILGYGAYAYRTGDLNADGFDDLVVNFFVDRGSSGLGEKADVWFGASGGLHFGERFENPNNVSFFLTSAGDVNGDGFADLIGSEWDDSYGLSNRGRVMIYNGSATGPDQLTDWELRGSEAHGYFGAGTVAVGDVDNDGFDDVAIRSYSGPIAGSRFGRVQIFRGSADGLAATASWTFDGPTGNVQFGVHMAGIGDVNGDGYSDFAIDEAPSASNVNLVHIYLGGPAGPVEASNILTDGTASSGFAGWISFAGDVNADGYSDLFIGRHNLAANLPGEVWLYLGGPGGFAEEPNQICSAGENDDGYGFPCLGGGDFDGDGYSDLLSAARYATSGGDVVGKVYLHYGNDGAGRDRRIRPELLGSSARIATAGRAIESSSTFELATLLRSAAGRSKVQCRLAFSGEDEIQHVFSGPWVDSGVPAAGLGSALFVKQTFTPGRPAVTWRANVVSNDPFFPSSAWFSPEGNATTAIDVRFIPLTADVEADASIDVLSLAPPTPNPARSAAEIRFTLARSASIDLSIFDVQGRKIARLYHGVAPAGIGSLTWTGLEDNGRAAPEGVYFVRLSSPLGDATQRLVRLSGR